MKVLSRAVLAAAMVLVASSAQAQTSLIFAAGATMPIGSTGDAVEMGYHGTVGLGIKPPLAPIGARIEGMFNDNAFKAASDASLRILAVTANATFAAMPTAYFIGGLGMYNGKCAGTCGLLGSESNTDFGFNIGGGLNIPLTGLGVFVEARLHIINTETESTKLLPITVGIKF
jgi:hypothetical protein